VQPAPHVRGRGIWSGTLSVRVIRPRHGCLITAFTEPSRRRGDAAASVPEEEIEEMEESKTYRDVDDSLMTREGSPAGTRTPGLRPSGLAPDLPG
jgi:hypothetical protein